VFSTVHTNNAPATITRLIDMGIEPYLVSSTLMAVLAQRLVRRICPDCRTAETIDQTVVDELGIDAVQAELTRDIFRGAGCSQCNGTGYRGRVGLFELLEMTGPVKHTLLETNEANVIREAALKNGMVPMRRYGLGLVRDGITTLDEVLQATDYYA
jgi:type II secretory ATPase GspE/PulE/Tfp pilus assembly ATPase PilB-like protein